ncbi:MULTISPECIES: hypothetical protein [Enterococcus]|uniref:Uncharacterized protein n=1 Tax=Enterococcus raffinosus TaxID=71452 RepID=A0AAW8TCL4_9ENTE|nr:MULTISPECIES: hypothetical protein [Enterococcus]MBU5581737.1 hypothetical protein [Enterococcus sp. S181_ASV_20]MDT2524929.1 hypothetical protein [Enterococcus raffinosus]MDT2535646.1 hypothetical protein [Enterococcus raffinosus]MDT2546024.1 hypothetical protein [Enterococcus raffinosus]MDT2592321.1 hypothetical protein [Enterococcus raffinosus]
MYKTNLLNQLDRLDLEEINQGIAELENNIGKTYFGNSFNEKLTVLYVLKKHADHKLICREINELKNQILTAWLNITDIREARVKTFNTWVKYQNQLKGAEFVRDGLKYELEQLKLMEVSE